MNYQFLFGKPVLPAHPEANGHRALFVLGAYPSALHVRWQLPGINMAIRAIAVDNEPEPFWNGADEKKRIEQWRAEVDFRDSWEQPAECGHLNGSSGCWLDDRVLRPLGLGRTEAWITDCLDTYYQSGAAADKLGIRVVQQLLAQRQIPLARHRSHPPESQIISLALADHAERLRRELALARPDQIITLGNAALRVLARLVEVQDGNPSDRSPDRQNYGRPLYAHIDGGPVEWLPLAHPGAPGPYKAAHDFWIQSRATIEPLGGS